ncbi:MAG: 3'-5' exonuclease [Cyanobacteriota bacterium]
MEAVQHWEQTDLLGLFSAPIHPAISLAGAGPAEDAETEEDLPDQAVPAPALASGAPGAAVPSAAMPVATASLVGVELPAVVVQERTQEERRWEGPVAVPSSLPGCRTIATSDVPPSLPERLLILDMETTALHPDAGECIEVGAVLFHVPTRSVLTQVSFLLPCRANGAEAINGIPAAVSRLEQPWRDAMRCFLAMATAADAILAHNAAFDRQWFGRGPLPALDKPWICSMEDIAWPPERHLRARPSVRDLAIAHGVPVWAAHRALTDCTYLAQVLERCDDLEGLLRLACEPRQLYKAQLSYSERHQAKEAGFRWNDPVPGAWTKRLSEREASGLPFPVSPVGSD